MDYYSKRVIKSNQILKTNFQRNPEKKKRKKEIFYVWLIFFLALGGSGIETRETGRVAMAFFCRYDCLKGWVTTGEIVGEPPPPPGLKSYKWTRNFWGGD